LVYAGETLFAINGTLPCRDGQHKAFMFTDKHIIEISREQVSGLAADVRRKHGYPKRPSTFTCTRWWRWSLVPSCDLYASDKRREKKNPGLSTNAKPCSNRTLFV